VRAKEGGGGCTLSPPLQKIRCLLCWSSLYIVVEYFRCDVLDVIDLF
jgi:hypothetical protein